jgi:hypothetical protein
VYLQVKYPFAVEERYFEHLGYVSPDMYISLHASYFQNVYSITSQNISENEILKTIFQNPINIFYSDTGHWYIKFQMTLKLLYINKYITLRRVCRINNVVRVVTSCALNISITI